MKARQMLHEKNTHDNIVRCTLSHYLTRCTFFSTFALTAMLNIQIKGMCFLEPMPKVLDFKPYSTPQYCFNKCGFHFL